jgi:hypothetical protein
MGLFGAVSASYNRAQASVVIQRILKRQIDGLMLDGNPVAMANRMVERVWGAYPDLFDGKTGPKPNKEAVAAYALAGGAAWEAQVGNEALHVAYTIALGSLMDELNRDAHAYPFHHVDSQLLERAGAGLSKEMATLEEVRKGFESLQ